MANWNACAVHSLCVRGNRAKRLKRHVKHNNFIEPDFFHSNLVFTLRSRKHVVDSFYLNHDIDYMIFLNYKLIRELYFFLKITVYNIQYIF